MIFKNEDGYVKVSKIKKFVQTFSNQGIGGICPICNKFHLGCIKCKDVKKYEISKNEMFNYRTSSF